MFGRGVEEALDVAPRREVLALRPQDDDPHAGILVQRLEHLPDLVALGHRDDIHRRPRQDHVGTLALGIDLDAEAVEVRQARVDGGGVTRHGAGLSLKFVGGCQAASWPSAGARPRPRARTRRPRADGAQQLADRRFRDLVHEDVAARQLVTRQAARTAMGVERRFVGAAAPLDEGRHDPAPALVGQAHDGDLGHGRMQGQATLDLDGRDVLAPVMIMSSTRPVT